MELKIGGAMSKTDWDKDHPCMDIAEFYRLGFLQEVNRVLLHPCGLALYIDVSEDGVYSLGGVYDYRDDPEGVTFGDLSNEVSRDKAASVQAEWDRHYETRKALFGDTIQPIGSGSE